MKSLSFICLVAVSVCTFAQTANSTYLFNSSLAPSTNVNGLAGSINDSGTPTYGSGNVLDLGSNKSYLNLAATAVLQTPTGLAANGGGSYVNQFTFIEAINATGAFGSVRQHGHRDGKRP